MLLNSVAYRKGLGHGIVAEGVLYQVEYLFCDLAQESHGVSPIHSSDRLVCLDELLNDTETVGVAGKINELIGDLIKDELSHLGLKVGEHLLNDMVALGVLRELDNVATECGDDEGKLFRHVNGVEHGLNRMRALLVAANTYELLLNGLQDLKALAGRAGLEEPLAEVVRIVVHHEVGEVLHYLVQVELDDMIRSLVKMLLKESAS